MIQRTVYQNIKDKLFSGKAIILIGARQTGKTTLLHQLFDEDKNVKWLNCDETEIQLLFENITTEKLITMFGNFKVLVFDEAQRISDIGLKLKLITDQIKHIQLIATGSSAFELSNNINEPLTGRKWEYQISPLSFSEIASYTSTYDEKKMLHHRLIYGSYPEIVTNIGNEKERLKQLTDSYLFKDILMWERIKKPEKLIKLLQALAFQVGNQVSYNEIGRLSGLDNETVEKYISLLEKIFVIFRLGSFSRNLRSEIKISRKIYFYDNGIRNAIISNFAPIELRQDIGQLWENYIIAERIKYIKNNNIWANNYFWRTHDQQEIDYIEESDGILNAYEFKWNSNSNCKFSKTFTKTYPHALTKIIHLDNYEEFLIA